MNAVHFEALIYALQIASFFLIAGPVMARTERRVTLAKNPSWLASERGFLEAHDKVGLLPFRVAAAAQLVLLGAAAVAGSRPWLFAVHTGVFLAVTLGFYSHYDRTERRLRAAIPDDPVRKASLTARRLSSFVPVWVLGVLALAAAAVLGLNAWAYTAHTIEPLRALGNVTVFSILAAGLGLMLRHSLGRAAHRLSPETDSSFRSLELSLTLAVAGFIVFVLFYVTLGSIGPSPLFLHPPTTLHALIEGKSWSWDVYFERAEYRWVELGTALFIAAIGPWLSRSSRLRSPSAAGFDRLPA